MAGIWLPSATVVAAPVDGGAFTGAPWRGCLHTTEGGTASGAISTFRSTNYWPHLTVDPVQRTVTQHISLDRAARALAHKSGQPATNGANCIQIEIVGYSDVTKHAFAWTTDMLDFLAQVMRDVEGLTGIPRTSGLTFKRYPSSYGAANGVRLTDAQWQAFSGWCGHMHVPQNDHGDPSDIDIDALLRGPSGATPAPTTTTTTTTSGGATMPTLTPAQFLAQAVPAAQAAQAEYGVPASVTLAQAAIESGWGNKHIGDANNYFGIKASTVKGQVTWGSIAIGYVTVKTREVLNGKDVMIDANFRKYASMQDSFRDHGAFLKNNKNYAAAFATKDGIAFAKAVAAGGYATDPNYAGVLVKLIQQYNLLQYDTAPAATPPSGSGTGGSDQSSAPTDGSGGSSQPTDESTQPTGESSESTDGSSQPTDESTQPTDESTEPSQPTDESSEPTDESSEPTDESSQPTDESSESSEPTDESTQPTDESSQPTDESSESSEPTDESTEPTDESSESTEPTDDSGEPTDESSQPTDESSEPSEPTDESTEPTDESTEPTDESSESSDGSSDGSSEPTDDSGESPQPTDESSQPSEPTDEPYPVDDQSTDIPSQPTEEEAPVG